MFIFFLYIGNKHNTYMYVWGLHPCYIGMFCIFFSYGCRTEAQKCTNRSKGKKSLLILTSKNNIAHFATEKIYGLSVKLQAKAPAPQTLQCSYLHEWKLSRRNRSLHKFSPRFIGLGDYLKSIILFIPKQLISLIKQQNNII